MTQETGTEPEIGQTAAVPSRNAPQRAAAGVAAWLRSDLFLPTASGPIGWWKILLALVCVAGATAVSLSRTVGAGSLNTIWIEDAKFLLEQALNEPFRHTVSTPISSYYQVPARLATQVAIQFPLSWAPGVMSIFAAAQYAMYGLVAYIASGPHLRSPWLRLLIAAPVCAIPLAYTQVNNDLVTVQFFGLYGAFWTCLWLPSTRAGKIVAPLVMWTVSWDAALSIVFAPLVVARLIVDRSKTAWAVAIFWASGVLLQFSRTLEGKSNHLSYGFNQPGWVLQKYASVIMPRALFGERSLGGAGVDYRGDYAPLRILNLDAHNVLLVAAWVIVAVVVVLAAVRFTAPRWTLAVIATLFSIGVFFDEMLINKDVVQTRYTVAPALLLYTALVALLRPRRKPAPAPARAPGPAGPPAAPEEAPAAGESVLAEEPGPAGQLEPPAESAESAESGPADGPEEAGQADPAGEAGQPQETKRPRVTARARLGAGARWLPSVGFAALLVVAITLNFRVTNGRTTSPAWTSVVAAATNTCQIPGVVAYSFNHEWWYLTIPCGKVG